MKKKVINFFIDQEKFETEETVLLARVLLEDFAKENPDETTLVLKHGNELKKYKDSDEVVLMNGLHFVVFHDEPTPVS